MTFGPHPGRPDHPDFWKLSAAMRDVDQQIDEAATPDAKEAAFKRIMARYGVDQESLSYVAIQRALRAQLHAASRSDASDLAKLAAVFIDGFISGCAYTREEVL